MPTDGTINSKHTGGTAQLFFDGVSAFPLTGVHPHVHCAMPRLIITDRFIPRFSQIPAAGDLHASTCTDVSTSDMARRSISSAARVLLEASKLDSR
ncbi:hypothetical protein B0H13DRAFT_2312809 [Mycena leptocephala]|nr:hypothetical protein B0H13DRAFT_2312809 [Mycena leptocephala]